MIYHNQNFISEQTFNINFILHLYSQQLQFLSRDPKLLQENLQIIQSVLDCMIILQENLKT